jgi:hypothetical protein
MQVEFENGVSVLVEPDATVCGSHGLTASRTQVLHRALTEP